jgi:hypothetical protein
MVQEPFKLLVVDSIMANLRTDYVGRGELSERQQRLGQYMKRLKQVCSFSLYKCVNFSCHYGTKHQPCTKWKPVVTNEAVPKTYLLAGI